MLVRQRNAAEVGWFGSRALKAIKKGVSGAAKAVGGVAKSAVSIAATPVRIGSDIAHGRNVVRSIGRQTTRAFNETKSLLPAAANIVAFVPGAGTVVSSGISAASALAQGKNIKSVLTDAALGAVPGGQLARTAMSAGTDIARGKNVFRTLASHGGNYAGSQIGGGQIVQSAIRAGSGIAQGQNVVRAIGSQALAVAAPRVSSVVQQTTQEVNNPMFRVIQNVRPNFGAPPSMSPENIARTRRLVTDNRPTFAVRAPIGNVRKASFRPLSVAARTIAQRMVPAMRREVSGLSEAGTQWIVESGDTASKIALKLTGNANRWVELRAVNPTIMGRSPDLIKKYGFPIYVGDKVNLPASWIKVSPTTPAQTAPAQPSATKPPAVEIPAGDLAAQAQARVILAGWGKSDGSSVPLIVGDYGSASELGATSWSARDRIQAAAFAAWWKQQNGVPAVDVTGDWSDALAKALNVWMERKAHQITNSAAAAGGYVIPSPIPVLKPDAALTVPSSPAAPVTPSPAATQAPPGSTPALTLPTVTITPPAGIGGQVVIAPAPAPATQASNAPARTGDGGMNDNQKWAIGATVGGSVLATLIRYVW